jgi:DNA invertase Pin-like site-specific DNA recombinase
MQYGYVRVSTKGQVEGCSIEEQIMSIKTRYPDAEIQTEAISGVKVRPVFNELMEQLQTNDLLVVTKLDRFCRTTKEGLCYIDQLISRNVRIHILNMGLIEDTPMGRLIVTNLLAFAEFERAMIIERTQSGKGIARTKAGFKEGHPKVYTDEQIRHAVSLLGENSYKRVTAMTGISKSTLIRAKRKN